MCEQEAEGERRRQEKEQERAIEEDFGETRLGRLRTFCWNMTEYPETGRAAQIAALTSLTVVIISTITFILSTLDEFEVIRNNFTQTRVGLDFVTILNRILKLKLGGAAE